MAHNIDSVEIRNFRSCKDVILDLTSFVPLVGYNNAGKSNILSALEWLLRPKLLASGDFYNPQEPIEVAGVISGVTGSILEMLGEGHREKISAYVTDGFIKIKRVQAVGAVKASEISLYIHHPTSGYQKNPTGISNALKELFPEPIRIAAMDNAADDSAKAKATSTIGKLLAEFCSTVKEKNSSRLDRHLNAISRRMSADGNKRMPELNKIDASINGKIYETFPGVKLKLHFETPTFEDIFKAGTVKVYEDDRDISRDFTAYGHGAQRSIQMALVRHLAEIRKEAGASTTTLLLIDEPELYLHPSAIEQVRESLHALSSGGYQVIFSTHSAQMITAERAQHTLLVRKTPEGTKTRMRLKDALETVVPGTIAQAQHLFSLTQSSQMLFAEKIILTEGKTESRLLPYLYSKISGRTLGQDKLAMIEVGSVESIAKSLQVLKAMDLPALAIVDLDYAFRGAVNNNFVADNSTELTALKKILLRLEGEGKCKLNDGLPSKKDAPCSPAKAFELLAGQADALDHIEKLHLTLRDHGIWLWRKGAIEAHIGLSGKKEQHWASFKADVENNGVERQCKDYESVCELLSWIK